jgi:galactose-1-phosphate uridylyltransferase
VTAHNSNQRLSADALNQLVRTHRVGDLDRDTLAHIVRHELGSTTALPDGTCAIDPRTGDVIVHTSARARRPHDNRPGAPAAVAAPERACPICEGKTTGIVDVAPLPASRSQTFINENLFPVLYPWPGDEQAAHGMHFVQWTSTLHDRDWHNLPVSDCQVVMERLAALEGALLTGTRDDRGYVLIIKNSGHLVGASLAHGHQQILWSNLLPRRLAGNAVFEEQHGEPLSRYLLRENPPELTVVDYGPALLAVPYFMRRPYDTVLIVKDTEKAYLSDLDSAEIGAVAHGWHDATRAMHHVLRGLGREVAYNVLAHNGPGAGLYFEFLPYVQEVGGLEHLGIYVCQETPATAAEELRRFLAGGMASTS